jgi:hypothetical protein
MSVYLPVGVVCVCTCVLSHAPFLQGVHLVHHDNTYNLTQEPTSR